VAAFVPHPPCLDHLHLPLDHCRHLEVAHLLDLLLGVKTGRDYPAGTGYGYLKYPVFRVPDTGNFVYGSDTDTIRIYISRIRVGYRMTTTRQIPEKYG
jgi:hypothetical protein